MYKSVPLRLALGLSAIALTLFGLGFYSSSAASSDDQVINSLGTVDSVRRLSLPTNDIVFNAADSRLYASIPGSAGSIGNSIAAIDPYAGTIGTPVWIGSEPSKLALANDGQTLYTYLAGAYSIGRYDTRNQQLTSSFLIGQDPNFGLTGASDLAISPDDPNVVAVARQPAGASFGPEAGVAVFNNGVKLPQFGGNFFYLAFSNSASTLYGSFSSGSVGRMTVSGSGVTTGEISSVAGSQIKFADGKIFAMGGKVVDAASFSLLGTFPNVTGAPFVPDTSVGRAYYVTQDAAPNTWVLRAFDTSTFTQIGSLTIPNVSGTPASLVRWGTNGLAFRTSNGQVVLIQTSLIPTPNPIPPPPPVATPTPTPTPFSSSIRVVSLSTNDVVYSSMRQKLLATVRNPDDQTRNNTLTEIDPTSGELGASTPVGSEPRQIAMSDDGSALFIGIDGAGSVRRFDIATSTLGPLVGLGIGIGGPYTAYDIDVLPGSTSSFAISRNNGEISVYDDGVRRPTNATAGRNIDFASPDVLFGSDNKTTRFAVGPGGLSPNGSLFSNTVGKIEVKNNRIYGSNGRVVDTSLNSVAGTYFGLGFENAMAVDVENDRIFFLTNNSGYSIRAYQLSTFRFIGSIPLPQILSFPRKIVRWGTNGLAFGTDFSRLYIIQSNLVDGGGPPATPTPTPTVTPTPSPTPAATFVRRLDIPANDLIYNSGTNSVVAAVAGSAGATLGNTMTHIDPATGQVLASTFIGSEPNKIAASDDGQTLWTTLSGANAIRSYDLVTRTPGLQFSPPSGFTTPNDMDVMPGSPATLAIAAGNSGVALFDNGVQRPIASTGGASSIGSIEFTENPNILYGYHNQSTAYDLIRFTASPTGVAGTLVANNLIQSGGHIKYLNGLLYSIYGRVVNPSTVSVLGTFQGGGTGMYVDVAANRVFFIFENTLSAFDLTTYNKIGSVTIPGYTGTATSLYRWGANGLVFRATNTSSTAESKVYLVQSALVSPTVPVPTGLALSNAIYSTPESQPTGTVTITRSGETSTTVSVDYATVDGTAVAGQDYTTRSGNVVFNPGETSKNITIPIINDNIFEGPESFGINLSNAVGTNVSLITPSSSTIFITDSDPRPTVNITNVSTSVMEPNLGRNAVVSVQVQLTNPSVETVTVNFNTSSATATAGADFVAASGVVTFAPLETAKSIQVQILPDVVVDPNETFTVLITNPTNGTINTGQSTVTIRDLNHAAHVFDFDGDAKTDIGISRPAGEIAEWWINRSSTGSTFALQFGASNDKIAPADFTGDGKADIAFFRPSSGEWYILRSEDFSFFAFPFGTNGDVPVPADYDADGKAEPAVFRPSTSTWYIPRTSDGQTLISQFGAAGDIPVPADYDGDGKADVAIFRPTPTGAEWWLQRSSAGTTAFQFGLSDDKPVYGDYTGDGKADVATWRPSTGEWLILRSNDSSYYAFPFGTNGDVVAPGDYDGDGKFDATVFRPSTSTWFIGRTSAGTQIVQFGATGDRPLPNAFIP